MKEYSELKKYAEIALATHESSSLAKSLRVTSFYGRATPTAVLELISEVESLKKDAARYRWLRQHDFDIGSYHPEGDFSHESWFERFDDQSIDRMIAEEIAFEEEAIIEANKK